MQLIGEVLHLWLPQISSLVSAGLLSTASVAVDVVIYKVKQFLDKNLKARAIVW
ncbi:MAG: uberolysin/carnocyclin family circular bacteriocin [Lactobacillales bacterium]|jgi:circularin A/uberolysin family circular bacteriocin|nr:uberolysin/carnocyclin family circular bacteriocin [Lactobacillales bacterium]